MNGRRRERMEGPSSPSPSASTPGRCSLERARALSEGAGGLWVTAVARRAGPPETVYASVLLQGIFKSVDGGASWQRVNVGLVALQADHLVAQAGHPGTVSALTPAGIFRTTNAGAQWTRLPSFPTTAANNATVIAVDPLASQTISAGLPDQLLKTVDGGQNWVRSDGQAFRGWYVDEIAIDPGAPNTVYVAAADFAGGASGLFRRRDRGSGRTGGGGGPPRGQAGR